MSRSGRAGVSAGAALALLVGGLIGGVAVKGAAAASGSCAGTNPCTFAYTGGEQTYVVPAGITSVSVTAFGARGGNGECTDPRCIPGQGGAGGRATATVSVTPGQTLYIEVGGAGDSSGFNGGGTPYDDLTGSDVRFGGGGGASDVRTVSRTSANSLTSRRIVAGGGGGAGGALEGTDGGDGGNAGADGTPGFNAPAGSQGRAGTQSAGGAGGTPDGKAGTRGTGGAAPQTGGGAGGGGYYGGGSGAGDRNDDNPVGSGGGGGSSYAPGGTVGVSDHAAGVTITPVTPRNCAGNPKCTTLSYTGGEQVYVVPAGVDRLLVTAVGGHGGANNGSDGTPTGITPGGRGAVVTGTLAVHPGEKLYIEVGGSVDLNGATGGFNGGGAAPSGGSAGGGASDVRTVSRTKTNTLASRQLVAGGGGGSAVQGDQCCAGAGGDADHNGGAGNGVPNGYGRAGTVTGGGAGGAPGGAHGTFGAGGVGTQGGGAGGGGYFGGGSGNQIRFDSSGNETSGGGGGGGASYTPNGTIGLTSDDASVSLLPVVDRAPSVAVTGGACDAQAASTGSVTLTLADPDDDAVSARIVSTSNPTLLPSGSVTLSGSGATRTLKVKAAVAAQTGTIRIRVSDGTLSTDLVETVITARDRAGAGVAGTSGDDMIFAETGGKTATAGDGDDLVCGSSGSDRLQAGSGNDIVDGRGGDDRILGYSGNDTLRGGPGNDTLTGATGADAFDGGSGTDTVTDYTPGQGDTETSIP